MYRLMSHSNALTSNAVCFFISGKYGVYFAKHSSRATPICWDYHVIAFDVRDGKRLVYDYDYVGEFPCEATEYVKNVLEPVQRLNACMISRPLARMVSKDVLLSSFASDRHHMLRPNGTYMSPIPNWPPYSPSKDGKSIHNLDRFIDMTWSDDVVSVGSIMTLDDMANYMTTGHVLVY